MSEQEFELYLKLLSRCLGFTGKQRAQISDELRDHLEERLEELARAGVPREKAVFQALDEFGDAAVLAAHFTTIAHLRRRRFLMRLSLGSVAALTAALFVAFAFWPENRAVQIPAPLFAQSKPKPDQSKPEKAAPARPLRPPAREGSKNPVRDAAVPDHPLSSDVGENPQIEGALDSPVDFIIDPQPLKDAVDFISQRYQIPIILDTKTLEDASIDTSIEVKMPVPGLKLRQILHLLLEQLPQPLGFDIWDGVLRITTVEKINEHRVVVVYDCRDLIHLRSMSPEAGMGRRRPANRGAIDGSASGQFMFQFGGTGAAKAKGSEPSAAPKASEKNAEVAKTATVQGDIPLVRVIRYAGTPEDWESEDGVAREKIIELGGLIVVNQNPIVHEQIKKILSDLRRMRKEGAFATLDKDQPVTAAPGAPTKETRPGL